MVVGKRRVVVNIFVRFFVKAASVTVTTGSKRTNKNLLKTQHMSYALEELKKKIRCEGIIKLSI
jgi:hypothetical protein